MRKTIAAVASLLVIVGTTAVTARPHNDAEVAQGEESIPIKPGSALAALVKEVEKHEMATDVAARKAAAVATGRRRKIDIEDWLKAHYLRNHPQARIAAVAAPNDPTEGFPLALESLQNWMLRHQDLRPDAPPQAAAKAKVGVGKNLRISGNNTTPRSESDIRINFADPKMIIAGSNNLGESRQAQFFSDDGGASWGQTTLPLLPGDSLHSDPTVDWTSDGTAWATTIGIDASTTDLEMRAYRSTDGGQTWTFDGTFSGDQRSADKQMTWVDRSPTSAFKDNIYVIWHNNRPAFINRRLSSGWQAPLQVSGAETTGTAIGSDITTNAVGEVFAVWPDTGSQSLFFIKSIDGGANFTGPGAIARTFGSFQIGVPAFARRALLVGVSIAAFRNTARNDVYVSWTDLSGEAGCNTPNDEPGTDVNSPCKSRIWFTRSTDGGGSWETARQVNPSADRSDQFNHKLAVDPNSGVLGIIYYGTGTGPDRKKTNLFFQPSVDNGTTWGAATKVTEATTDETTSTADLGNQYGDYNGLSVVNGVFFPCWTDRRNNESEAIFTARISVTASAAGSPVVNIAGK
jgi:hypothetical protein